MVCARLADVEQVRPSHVHGAKSELLGNGIDVGCLVDHGGVLAAEDGVDPLGCALPASDETLRSKLHHVSNVFKLAVRARQSHAGDGSAVAARRHVKVSGHLRCR